MKNSKVVHLNPHDEVERLKEENRLLAQGLAQANERIRVLEDDFCAERMANQRNKELAAIDRHTGFLNKITAYDEAGRLLSYARRNKKPLTVFFMDIDDFKPLNTKYTEARVDGLIVSITRRLKWQFRGSDVIARFGGDEFVVLLPDVSREGAAVLAEKIHTTFAKHPVCSDGIKEFVGFSIGIAEACEDDSAEELIQRANLDMRRIKAAKKAAKGM